MSAVSDILLAPDVRPFAVAAAIMAALGAIELLTTLVGFSISGFGRPTTSLSRPIAMTPSAACFSGSMRGACRS